MRPNPTTSIQSTLTANEVDRLIDEHFPEIHFGGRVLYIDTLTAHGARVRLKSHPKNLRPGGTVSGPAMFSLADYGAYVAILARAGAAGLQSVTTNINLNFMRRPQPGDVIGEIELIKFGKRLIVAEIGLSSEGNPALVAHAVATFAMPDT
jgi:uncharacterized protein (TIGR00369 family)